jgi:hypothetical protein
MIIVADASPLHYLILIEQITVLPLLYGQVIAPAVVPDSQGESSLFRRISIADTSLVSNDGVKFRQYLWGNTEGCCGIFGECEKV